MNISEDIKDRIINFVILTLVWLCIFLATKYVPFSIAATSIGSMFLLIFHAIVRKKWSRSQRVASLLLVAQFALIAIILSINQYIYDFLDYELLLFAVLMSPVFIYMYYSDKNEGRI